MKILSYNPGHDGAFAYVEDPCEPNCAHSDGIRADQSSIVRVTDCVQSANGLRSVTRL
jgi:hypothetical protein